MAKNASSLEKLPQWKIAKLVATRCPILRLKCTKFDFGCGSAPDSTWGVNSTPQTPLLDLGGPASMVRERE